MKPASKTLIVWAFMALMLISVLLLWTGERGDKSEKLAFSEVIQKVESGAVNELTFKGNEITGTLKSGRGFTSYGPSDLDTYHEVFAANNLTPNFEPENDNPFWFALLANWLPLLIIFGFFILFMRQMQVGGGKAMSFGKSKARIQTDNKKKVTFADVSGVEEAKEELQDIVEFLKDPKRFTRLGGRIPKGVLLMGSPGTGKTLLARAIAGEAGVPFFTISGSEFVEMFVGVGASRVRDLFEQGKKHAPCLIFIDEIDAVGRHRGAGMGGGHDEREQTLNQLLVEMDGFEGNEGVILIAATNRPDVLDPALLRPGRFDRRVVVPRPDVRGREGILRVHGKKMRMADDVDLESLARGTAGFSGADLENLVNEAALLAARTDKKQIDMEDFDAAKDKVMMGPERRSMVISDEEKKVTAFHEAGHALVAHLIPGADPLHRVTIIPRGMALGLTQQLPQEDRYSHGKEYLISRIIILMGGRVAEEIALGEITTGAGNDIERATDLARKMVCEWGMSALGPIAFGKKEGEVFLGREVTQQSNMSQHTAQAVDTEILRIITVCHEHARALIAQNRGILDGIANALLMEETLTLKQIEDVMELIGVQEIPLPAI